MQRKHRKLSVGRVPVGHLKTANFQNRFKRSYVPCLFDACRSDFHIVLCPHRSSMSEIHINENLNNGMRIVMLLSWSFVGIELMLRPICGIFHSCLDPSQHSSGCYVWPLYAAYSPPE